MTNSLRLYSLVRAPLHLKIPFVADSISAGFPSPATDYIESRIDLNEVLIKNPSATFLARVSGYSMQGAGISEGDVLIVDKSIRVRNEAIAVCCLNGEFTLKRIHVRQQKIFLMPENDDYEPIELTEGNELLIWGIVTYVIKQI